MYELSICIPTYNRAASVVHLVDKLLSYPNPAVEVVVLDNGSTDDTLAQLALRDDSRLAVHSNGTNRGVLFNVLHSLDSARGRFAALLLDKDDCNPDSLVALQTFLSGEKNLVCGYCLYPSEGPEDSPRVFPRGREAFQRVAYLGHHPTGYFFRMDALRAISFTQRFSDFDFVGHFCFDFIFAELALQGDIAVYPPAAFSPEPLSNAAQHKSIGTNASREDAFFSPQGRLKISINAARHARGLAIGPTDKTRAVAERFLRGIMDATLGYRSIRRNESLCAHYHMAMARISPKDMFRTAIEFHQTFTRSALARVDGQAAMSSTSFHLQVASLAMGRLANKFLRTSR